MNTPTTGRITEIRDRGSTVSVLVTQDDECVMTVNFDRRAFRWLLQGERCLSADLIGRDVTCDGDCLRFGDDDDDW